MSLDEMKQKGETYTRIAPIADANMTRPHVETNYNSAALGSRSSGSVKHVGLVGSAEDGRPGVVYKLSSLMDAKRIFRGGDIVEAAEMVWNPNKKLNQGGGTIYAMRIENAKPAQLKVSGLTFSSKLYGAQANKVRVELSKNVLSNAYKIVVDYAPSHYRMIYDNLGQLFKLQYTGSEGYTVDKAVYSVTTDANGMAKTFTLDVDETPKATNSSTTGGSSNTTSGSSNTTGGSGNTTGGSSNTTGGSGNTTGGSGSVSTKDATTTESNSTSASGNSASSGSSSAAPVPHHIHQEFDLNLASNAKLYDFMKQLSLIPNLKVRLLDHGDNVRMLSNILDSATNVDITGDINDPAKCGYVWGVRGDIVDKLETDSIVSVVADYTKPLVESFDLTALTGGETGEVPLSWSDKLDAFSQVPVYYVVPLTSSAAIHQEVKEFVNQQNALSHPMRAYVGGGFNEGLGNAISRQLDLKNARVCLVANSGLFETYDGVVLHAPAYLFAALAAGVQSGLEIGGDLTNKYVNVISLDQNFDSGNLDTLYNNGILSIEAVMNRGQAAGFRFTSGVTTYNSTNEEDENAIVKNRTGLGELTDFLFGDLRVDLEQFIGEKLVKTSPDLIKNEVDSFLFKQQLAPNRSVVDYDPNSIEVIIDGTTAFISFAIIPALTLDYIKVYGAYNTFTASSTNSGANGSSTSSSNILYNDYRDIPTPNSAGYDF